MRNLPAREQYATLSVDQKRELLAALIREKQEPEGFDSRQRDVMLTLREQQEILESCRKSCLARTLSVSATAGLEAQAKANPEAIALIAENRSITYQDLQNQAHIVASYLESSGFGRSCVGLAVGSVPETVAELWGLLKAGCTAAVLFPSNTRDEIDRLIPAADAPILVSATNSDGRVWSSLGNLISWEMMEAAASNEKPKNQSAPRPSDEVPCFAYTDRLAGGAEAFKASELLEFFEILQHRMGCRPADTLLTDLDSADIFSLVQVLWVLSTGGKVVLSETSPVIFENRRSSLKAPMDFSLLFFSSDEADEKESKYRLFLEASRFADRRGFRAVWFPERHFHQVGGLFPNPAVLGAALAVTTQQIRLRAGSVVLPLHHPVRVAEEWSVVDNLSGGRVDISFARGWNPNDFVLSPENFSSDNQLLISRIDTVRRLWRGETISLVNSFGEAVEVRIYPLPVQPELKVWLTCLGSPERFVEAAVLGANVLTMLLNQNLEEMGKKIGLYREQRAAHGHVPETGIVSLMLHAFVHRDMEYVRTKVREPFLNYIKGTISLHTQGAKAWRIEPTDVKPDQVAEYAYERYFRTSALFGTPDSCLEMVELARQAGLNEIACQIDFGLDSVAVLEGLEFLAELKDRVNKPVEISERPGQDGYSKLRLQIKEHRASHVVCTRPMAERLMIERRQNGIPGHLKVFIKEESTFQNHVE